MFYRFIDLEKIYRKTDKSKINSILQKTMICPVPQFSLLKVNLLNLNFNLAMKISLVPPPSQIKIWGKSVKGLLSYDQTYKPTIKHKHHNRDYYFMYKPALLGN